MSQREIESIIVSILKKYSISRVGVFGSFARNEINTLSDIDLLVSFIDTPSLLQLVKIEREISEAVGYKIDLITENSIQNSKLKAHITKDLKVLYNA
jgi:predicted nucleotidyltransferase